jgi:hypothetical protein
MSVDALQIIARVRRAMPRNADVMAVCDLIERNMRHVTDAVSEPRHVTDRHVTALSEPFGTACPKCAAHRARALARQRKHRAREHGAKKATEDVLRKVAAGKIEVAS